MPARSLADEGPEYDREIREPAARPSSADDPAFLPFEGDLSDALLTVLGSPNVASTEWVHQQYDSLVGGQTVAGPGSDAAIVRVPDTMKALALSSDGKGRFGSLDPYLGSAHAVAEAARNVAVSGAVPLAVTNCLNFGNPERPEVMWQFSEAIRGMRDACAALDTPVTGGNVSFYNESADSAIWPTPVIGMLGLLDDYRLRVPSGFPRPGLGVYLLGETQPELGGSEFAEVVLGVIAGRPPALDLVAEARPDRVARRWGRPGVDRERPRLLGGRPGRRVRGIGRPRGPRVRRERARRPAPARDAVQRIGLTRRRERRARACGGVRRASPRRMGVPCRRLGETGGPRAVVAGRYEHPLDRASRGSLDGHPSPAGRDGLTTA